MLDAFHVVRLGTQVVDEVRRRVQQETLRRRGHRDDPLYKIRGLLRHGAENLSPRQQVTARDRAARSATRTARSTSPGSATSSFDRPTGPSCRSRADASPIKIIDTWPTCPDPRVARLGRTLRQWRQQVLAYFVTKGVSNGGTEAINLLIEKTSGSHLRAASTPALAISVA